MITRLIWSIWTPMSSVPKKSDKLNLSLSLALCKIYNKIVDIPPYPSRPTYPLCVPTAWGILTSRLNCLLWSQAHTCLNSLRPSDRLAAILVTTTSANGLSPVWCQVSAWTNCHILSIKPIWKKSVTIQSKYKYIPFRIFNWICHMHNGTHLV